MWHRKRLLKKDKRQVNKKRLLFISFVLGVLGLGCIGLGTVLLMREPLYTSPLPLLLPKYALDDEKVVKSQIEAELRKRKIEFTSISSIDQNSYKIIMKENGEVFMSSEKDVMSQLSSLQVIMQRLTMEGKKFSRLDLRYDRPVISLR